MSDIIYPRSPKEIMSGWVHLPRFVDKIRLSLAGKLADDYTKNFTKGFDGWWLTAAGLEADAFIAVVKNTIIDGQVADWVAQNIKKTDVEKAAFATNLLDCGRDGDAAGRLQHRKDQAGVGGRADIQTFVDLIDADEKRL
jgi:hypothetical protein